MAEGLQRELRPVSVRTTPRYGVRSTSPRSASLFSIAVTDGAEKPSAYGEVGRGALTGQLGLGDRLQVVLHRLGQILKWHGVQSIGKIWI